VSTLHLVLSSVIILLLAVDSYLSRRLHRLMLDRADGLARRLLTAERRIRVLEAYALLNGDARHFQGDPAPVQVAIDALEAVEPVTPIEVSTRARKAGVV
jgi:hypothetical protein